MSTNPEHVNQLAAIIREVDGRQMIASAADRAEAILGHPGWLWQPPAAALAQPEGEGQGERIISIAKAVQEHAFGWEPDARLIGNVCAEDVADLCSAVLARWGRPTASPAPEGEVVELVAALKEPGDPFPEYRTITSEQADRIAALLQQQQHLLGLACAELDRMGAFSAPPAPAVVAVAVSERPWERPGWLDREGRCWFLSSRFSTWSLDSPPVALARGIGRCLSLPACAIPLPQVGEVEA